MCIEIDEPTRKTNERWKKKENQSEKKTCLTNNWFFERVWERDQPHHWGSFIILRSQSVNAVKDKSEQYGAY